MLVEVRCNFHSAFRILYDMITNQLMLRKMGDFDVIQRTKDGFFNSTLLLKQWNKLSEKGENIIPSFMGMMKKKDLDDYLFLKSTKEFISTIMFKENRDDGDYPYRKSRANKGDNMGTWMHPLLFVDFAMWLNPSLKYDALKFVYDKMIEFRNKAGDAYKTLASSVQKIVNNSFMQVAMQHIGEAINWIIFDCHEKELRNKFGSEEKQNELYQFEIKVATLIDEGFITNYDNLMNYLRKQYANRHKPF